MTHPYAYRVLVVLAAAISIVGAACQRQSTPAATLHRSGGQPAAVIVISDNPAEFVPSAVTIKVGDAVEWRNTGAISHSVDFIGPLAANGAGHRDGRVIAPSGTYVRTFAAPGTYSYACRFHIINGMIGKITVVARNTEPAAQ